MKITCESCGGEDWQMMYYERKGSRGVIGPDRLDVVYSAFKCNNCGRIYPLANLTHGLGMISVEHARDFLKNSATGQNPTTFRSVHEEYHKYSWRKQKNPSLEHLPDIDNESIKIMRDMGVISMKELAKEDPEELCKILDMPREQVFEWVRIARDSIGNEGEEEK